jgi:threonine synthase
MIAGFRCAVCGTTVDIAVPFAWKCPRATATDPHHVLHIVEGGAPPETIADDNPFVRYGPRLAWWGFARANGMTASACEALTRELTADFSETPFERSGSLSDALGADIWVKDETGNVAGSHKARHLVSIMLHLRAAEVLGILDERPALAIASCGNAALAAATIAQSMEWPIEVSVPTWMDDGFGDRLDQLDANIIRCERRPDDPPGDPAMLRFRESVARGAIPFSVQGPENGYCLDGGRTIGWEMADQAEAAGVVLDRIVIQVGGAAFASCVGAAIGPSVRLDTVQSAGCAPLAAAIERSRSFDHPEQHWAEVMEPWPDPASLADGIIDDETYDWIAAMNIMRSGGGSPIVASESDIERAHDLATEAGFDVSVTGSAGLAGVLTIAADLRDDDHIAVVMSGVARSAP